MSPEQATSSNATPPTARLSPRGPPTIGPLVSKRSHRRGPYACDECRLRKRACDAAQPCKPCRRSGTDCTYAFRRPAPRPTSRIRTLQNHLQQARGWLQHIKDKTPGGIPELDLDACLRSLDFSSANDDPPQPRPKGDDQAAPPQPPKEEQHRPLIGSDRFAGLEARRPAFHGAYSDVSFIAGSIELLETQPSDAHGSKSRLDFISSLLSRPLQSHLVDRTYEQQDQSLVDALLDGGDLMICFLQEECLRDIAQHTHVPNTPRSEAERSTLCLIHFVLALGYQNDARQHRAQGCDDSVQKATQHFSVGIALAEPGLFAQDLTSLSALLGAIVFLLSSYRTSMAHSLIGAACSAALRLGLLSTSCSPPDGTVLGDSRVRTRLLAGVLVVDMLASLVLDLPTFIHPNQLPRARLEELATEAENSEDVHTAALLKSATLLSIPLSLRGQASSKDDGAVGGRFLALQKAQEACHGWKRDVASLMSKMWQTPKHRGAKTDLDNMFRLCQIFMFRPHLHYFRDMYLGETVSVAESYYALACIKVASSTILAAENLAKQQPAPSPFGGSWLTTHVVFSSVMCLVFLVAAHPATTLPSVAWQRACRGIRIIAANRCTDNMSSVCLELLKLMTHSLRQTIYIDFDQIEATTLNHCSDMVAPVKYGSNQQSRENTPALADIPMAQRPVMATVVDQITAHEDYFHDNPLEVENEADKMLEQAEALSVEFHPYDLLNLGGNDGDWGTMSH
ncbi:uncharacterized protein J7T54_007120 [Emericellopsis cladophorae]|uniref:Zn(2)-C6 fungal-type domain-containing protein n=1 Tax=Emericellopsis cladophorae TaxID=2686198 RepID=A0A9Q0BGX6_9HYPO|nr:uncharacterized protein J7T54_007120 [Emericellopsis cladophorae]KAI6785477.1 hypothetical protein J7T54_007120 [Emericellopsis cladophorae]